MFVKYKNVLIRLYIYEYLMVCFDNYKSVKQQDIDNCLFDRH